MPKPGLLGIEELSRAEIEAILDRAKFFQPQRMNLSDVWTRCAGAPS